MLKQGFTVIISTCIIIMINNKDWTVLPSILQTELNFSIFDPVWYVLNVCARFGTTPYTLLLYRTTEFNRNWNENNFALFFSFLILMKTKWV